MEIIYKPNVGIEILGEIINWNTSRENVRKTLNSKFECADSELDNSELFDGDNSFNINLKRDIYKKIQNNECLIFMNYDENEKLYEIEIHKGVTIKVADKQINFSKNIYEMIENIGSEYEETEKGNINYKKLKLNFCSSEYMGGEFDELDYIFLSRDEINNE